MLDQKDNKLLPKAEVPNRTTLTWAIGWGAVLAVIACYIWGDTEGRRFRSAMKDREAYCRKEKLGPYLDKTDPGYKQKVAQTDCDVLLIKRLDPLETEEGRYAHSLKLPPPHDRPKDVYRWWMTGESYFKALCEEEAGEWVLKTVENVDSLVSLRSFPAHSKGGLGSLLVSEDIYPSRFHVAGAGLLESAPRYAYLEIPEMRTIEGAQKTHFIRYNATTNNDAPKSYVDRRFGAVEVARYPVPTSRFGVTQRGIHRASDLTHGIRGAELLIVDRIENEVLAFSRSFRRYTIDQKSGYSTTAHACPGERSAEQLIKSVLKPVQILSGAQ